MCVSLPSDKLWDVAVGSFLFADTASYSLSGHIISGWGYFCVNRHTQLSCLCFVTQNYMLNVSILWLIYLFFLSFFSSCIKFGDCLSCSGLGFSVISSSWYGYYYRYYTQSLDLLFSGLPLSFIRTWSGYMCKDHITLQKLQAVKLMLCKWLSIYLVRWLPYICMIVLLKLIYVIKVLQYPLFLSILAFCILNLTDKHHITLIQHIYLLISVWKLTIFCGEGCFQNGNFFLAWLK